MKRFSAMMVFGAWMLISMQCWADDSLGRLFYTPEQRARMDVARQHERNIKIDEEESTPPPVNIHLNGVITRSDGRSTVWINNKVQSGDQATQGIVVGGKGGRSGEVGVAIPGVRGNVPLKVGQSIDVSSGQVEEVYRRPPPTPLPEKSQPLANVPDTEKRSRTPDNATDREEGADASLADVPSIVPPTR